MNPKNGTAAPPAPPPLLVAIPPGLKLTSIPPAPAIFTGGAASFGIAGISGSETFASPVVVIRFAIDGALMVLCFFAICTLCSSARVDGLGEGGPPLKVSLRFA